MSHRHTVSSSRDVCYSAPVAGARENRAAHGCICVVEKCSCGAIREANVNGRHVEQGRWVLQEGEL